MSIGYVGLGNMGGALASRLQLTHTLFVHDRSDVALERLHGEGAVPCATLADVTSRCEVILLCLPTSDHVREVIFGVDGLAGTVKPGTLIVDQTTGDPNATRQMSDELAHNGVELIDAPVSGGTQGAAAGTIAIMVGASAGQYERALPILRAISPNVFHAGDVGAGHTIKLVNNVVSGAQRLLTLESVALAVKNGVEPTKAVQILVSGGARNAYLQNGIVPRVIEGKLAAGFTLGLAHKDVRLACQLGIDSGVPMFFGNLTREVLQMCISEMGRDAQIDTAALVMDRLAGTQVVAPDYNLD